MLLSHATSFLLPHACMSSSTQGFPPPPPQFCDVFVAVATIQKRKEANLVTGQIEEESKQFLQSCYDVFATFKKNQVSRLLPCFSPYQNVANLKAFQKESCDTRKKKKKT
jgi:hypothetical protein